jgi:hypothetical protein
MTPDIPDRLKQVAIESRISVARVMRSYRSINEEACSISIQELSDS